MFYPNEAGTRGCHCSYRRGPSSSPLLLLSGCGIVRQTEFGGELSPTRGGLRATKCKIEPRYAKVDNKRETSGIKGFGVRGTGERGKRDGLTRRMGVCE